MIYPRFKIGSLVNISQDLYLYSDIDIIIKDLKTQLYKKKGFYLFDFIVNSDRNGSDFINDLVSVVMTAFVYKKPRFIKTGYEKMQRKRTKHKPKYNRR